MGSEILSARPQVIGSQEPAEGQQMRWDVHVIIVDSDNATFDAASTILRPSGYRVSWAPDFKTLDRLSIADPADAYLIADLPDWAADDVAQEVEYRSQPAPAIVWLGKPGDPSVSKPLQAEDVLRILRRELGRRQ